MNAGTDERMNAYGTPDSVRCAVLLSGGVPPFIRSSVHPHIAFIRSSVPAFIRISPLPFPDRSPFGIAASVPPFLRSTVPPQNALSAPSQDRREPDAQCGRGMARGPARRVGRRVD